MGTDERDVQVTMGERGGGGEPGRERGRKIEKRERERDGEREVWVRGA